MPSLTSGCPNFAFSLATRTWHDIASSQPPPRQKPFTTAIVGLGLVSKRRNTTWPARARCCPSSGDWLASSLMSAPATKARPAPVSRITPTSGLALASSIARPSSAIVASLSALSLSGRLTVIVAIRSAISKVRLV